jgi:hypothetical protein
MNHRIFTTSLSALFVGTILTAAQQPDVLEPVPQPPKQSVPVLKDIPIIKQLFTTDVEKQGDLVTKVKGGVVTLKTAGEGQGKATITIDINGKKETREIDLGNATEIKITTDSSNPDLKPARVTYFGVAPEELSEELASQLPIEAGSGLLVRSVVPESPAAVAGIQKNDILLKLDEQTLNAPKQLQKLVASRKPGDVVKIAYLRRGQRAEVEAKLAEHEQPADYLFLSKNPDVKGEFSQNFQWFVNGKGKKVPVDPLSFQKKIVILDKEGNVVAKDDAEAQHAEAIKRMSVEVERMRDQAAAAQKQAQEAIRHAEKAAREAAEIAKKEAAAVAERMRDTVKQLQEQLEKQQQPKREQ